MLPAWQLSSSTSRLDALSSATDDRQLPSCSSRQCVPGASCDRLSVSICQPADSSAVKSTADSGRSSVSEIW